MIPRPKDDREKKIEDLKRRAEELCNGEMKPEIADDCPAEVEESFWKYVVDYEKAPYGTHFQQLETAGVSLPAPDSLSDEQLTAKLWEVIHALGLLRVFLEQTDHLSDRQLYTHLWADALREESKMLPPTSDWACHLEMIGSGSEEDNHIYLKYYADEKSRRLWRKDFPRYPLPAHEDPPYDRDRLLPKPNYSEPHSEEPN